MSAIYPLSAIVGQEALLEALLVNAVAPEVGGVLVRGERGTAKSTAVRALAPLLPHVSAAEGQPYAFEPGELAPGGRVPADAPVRDRAATLVELPLGATLDRLVGALDLSRALAGEAAFEPGLLARAHRGILYVDEVNLLPDHLVDALLDAAASGVARVEREAVSVEHAARFVLVGTMNVEEGELRPQLLDRFGLGVEVRAPRDAALRAEIVRRRLAFERDPRAFAEAWRAQDAALAARITAAQALLPAVRLPERELLRITGACAALGVDGVRGDIVSARAARALAALDGVDEVSEAHVRRAAALALAHRRQRDPLGGGEADPEELERALSDADPGGTDGRGGPHDGNEEGDDGDDDPDGRGPAGGRRSGGNGRASGTARERSAAPIGAEPPAAASAEQCTSATAMRSEKDTALANPSRATARERRDPPAPAGLPLAALTLDGRGGGPQGRRARSGGAGAGAIDTREAPRGVSDDVAVVASLRARLTGAPELREHVRAGRESALIVLVVDASGSMGARRRLARVKGALLALLRDAYARRDRVALVAFRASEAHVVVVPGAPLEQAAAAIRALPTGGRTPLAAGLETATQLVARERTRERERRTIALVLTDGRVSDPDGSVRAAAQRLGRAADAVHVVDTEDGPVRLGLAATLAAAAGGRVHGLTTDRRAA
ncbi:MAG TPA: VWA domain-containing protein [Conexibacter sp.]|jgi:magnesium chelatase subunit D|nr:VWA domain-containing protein [Conexibacter sp.]